MHNEHRATMEPGGMSRRGFFKAAAATAAVTAVAATASPHPEAAYALKHEDATQPANGTIRAGINPIEPLEAPAEFDYTADIVVVGGGGSGLAAAATAAERGANVILVEKNGFCGGDTSIAMAAAVTGTNFQLEIGEALMAVPDSGLTENPFAYKGAEYCVKLKVGEVSGQAIFMDKSTAGHACTPNPQFGRNTHILGEIYDAGPETFNWLQDHGCNPSMTNFGGLDVPGGGFCPVEPSQVGKPDDWMSWAPHNARGFTETLEPYCNELGVTILKSHPAQALLVRDGAVAGVMCEDTLNGKQVSVGAKAVILASGGYAANMDMIEEHVDPLRVAGYRCWSMPGATGDGIRMAQGLGAATRGMQEVEMWDGGVEREYGATEVYRASNQLCRQKSMTVNLKGKRFFDESWYDGYFYSYQSSQTIQQPEQTSCTILDSTMIKKEDIINKFHPTFCEYPCNWFDETFAEDLEAGIIKKADTIEELAEMLGVDPQGLKEEVEHYNQMCDNGYDDDFYKDAKFMWPIREAPFYGVRQKGGSVFATWGGLVTDDTFHVLDENWDRIGNLFACGEQTWGGSSLGLILPAGRLAGGFAADEIA